jgi:hypothetical protein
MATWNWVRILAVSMTLSGGAYVASAQAALTTVNDHRVPVLVELFTSEGCSDCPPADALLQELDTKQPISGADAIVLSEHVTYWNHLGWSDPCSLPEMDARQQEYGTRFHLDSIYTPQVVVDGAAQMVGNNGTDVARAVANAAKDQKLPLSIADAHWEKGAAVFTVHGADASGAKLIAALAADATRSEVARGENAGRTLHHVAVVRTLKEFGPEGGNGRVLRLTDKSLGHEGPAARLVVFLIDRKTGRVLAATEQRLDVR